METRTLKWDKRMLLLAAHISTWSKDPSTQVGAVISDGRQRVVSVGYNGFPQGVPDKPEYLSNRDEKYPRVVHGEINAILFADSHRLPGSTLYTWPFMPCERCAAMIVQTGISRVVFPVAAPEQEERWGRSFGIARETFGDSGVLIHGYSMDFLKT